MSAKVEKGKNPKVRVKADFPFDEMLPGNSFLYKGPRSSAIVRFAYRAIQGKYKVESEGDEFRFFMLEDPLHPEKGKYKEEK